jgi:hypothetical protein
MTLRKVAHFEKIGIRNNLPILLEQLSSRWMAAPFLSGLALLGAVRRPWKKSWLASHLLLVLVPCVIILGTFSLTWFIPRFYFVLLPFLLIWAANGLVGVGLCIKGTLDAAHWYRLGRVAEWVVPGLIGLVVVLYPIKGVKAIPGFQRGSRASQYIKDAGVWVGHQQSQQVLIMDGATPLAYHANARWVAFPYCDSDLALRFLDAEKVDYLVLRQGENYAPFYKNWLVNGVPSKKAELVYDVIGPDGNKLLIFRWQRGLPD